MDEVGVIVEFDLGGGFLSYYRTTGTTSTVLLSNAKIKN